MKHKIIPIMVAVVWGLYIFALPAQGKYGGGTGEPNDPYLIYDANQMNEIGLWTNAGDWNKCFKLMADIDLSAFDGEEGREKYNVIGNTIVPFVGVFEGNDHIIYNFTYNASGYFRIGLFGYVGASNAEIKNLGLIDPDVDAGTGNQASLLVCYVQHGTITACYAVGGSVSGGDYVGGLVGINQGTITNCYSTSSVSGEGYVGGLVGGNTGTITNCSSAGSVIGNESVGGLVGWERDDGTITNCYSTGDVDGGFAVSGLVGANNGNVSNCYSTGEVSGYYRVGGLVGSNRFGNISSCYSTGDVNGVEEVGSLVGANGDWHTPGGAISNCYSTGSVSGDRFVGGLVGTSYGGVTDSFWDVNTSGLDYSAGGVGKTTNQMQTRNMFIDAGWDFVEIWNIGENQTYPYLRVYLPSDINKDGIVNFLDVAITANQWMEEYFLWNRPPEVLITYPQDGDRLMVGGVPPQTMILAEANDYDGTVIRVEFFDDNLKLGEDTDGSDGWSYLWQGYSLGYHTLTAVAWDQEGLSGTSPPVNVEVWMPFPPPP